MPPLEQKETRAAPAKRLRYTFSIAKKIWLSLGLLLLGYSATMVFSHVRGSETRALLTGFADRGFPAAVESQAALTAFKEQVSLYADAVTMGELDSLDEAEAAAGLALAALRRLQGPLERTDPRGIRAAELVDRIRAFTTQSRPVYEALATSADVDGLFDKAEILAAEFAEIDEQLEAFKDSVSSDVKDGLHSLSKATERLWYTNLVIFLAVVIAAFGLASYIIHRWITAPLRKAARFAGLMAAGDLSQQLKLDQEDELGELAKAFNAMASEVLRARSGLEDQVAERTVELEVAHKKLMSTARLAGMAEVASSVLHNVGNVLNSVNVTTESLRSRVEASRVGKLNSVCNLLEENSQDLHNFFESDPRGSKLVPYVLKLAEHLEDDQNTQLEMLKTLRDHVGHITSIIAQQQSNSRAENLVEEVNLVTQIHDALNIAQPNAGVHGLVPLERFTQPVPVAHADRHKILQILVNLFKNAYQAIENTPSRPPALTIELKTTPDGQAEISITDSGIGISEENMEQIFAHGFTTKADGHGFGLHSSFLAAIEMNGHLSATSPGVGHGATFTLTLPTRASEPSPA